MQVFSRRVLLTGATGGLGRVTAEALAERGATLILTARDPAKLGALAARLPGSHEWLAEDLTLTGAPERLVQGAGHVDILVANAGLGDGDVLGRVPMERVKNVVRVNFEAPVELARAVIPQMAARGSGQIVLISSMAAKVGLPGGSLYSSTKAGLRMFAWALRAELAADGIEVTLVSPSFVEGVGMSASRNGLASSLTAPTAPGRYADRLVRAIERGEAEAVIASPQARAIGQFSQMAPRVTAALLGRLRPKSTRA